jgi:hypothetical protein
MPVSCQGFGVPTARAVGQASADAFGFYLGAEWIWAAVGFSWFWLLLCMAAGVLALSLTNPPTPRPTGEPSMRGRGLTLPGCMLVGCQERCPLPLPCRSG